MRLLNRFQAASFQYLLIITLLLALPALTLAGSSDAKKSDQTSVKTSSASVKKSTKPDKLKIAKNKPQPKDKNESESYPSNCAPDEPDCANQLHPETAPPANNQILPPNNSPETAPLEVSASWFDSLLRTVGLGSEPQLMENFVSGPAGECPDGFRSLGGNFISDPTVTTFKDKVYIFARGMDNALYYQVLEKGKKNQWISLGGNSISNPGSYFNDKGLFVEVVGTDGQKYYRSTTDGVTFSEWTLGTVNARSTNSKVGIRGSALTFVKGKGENPPLCYQVIKGSKEEKSKKEDKSNKSNNGNKNNAAPGDGGVSALRLPDDEGCWWDPWCEPPPPPTDQYSPIGWFDSIDTNSKTINGWSFDPDHSDWSNVVHIYIDGYAGSGTGQAWGIAADQFRPDVNAAYGITGNHGFSFQIPAQYFDGQQHVVYVYGIDTGPNSNSMLQGSPKYFTINPPPPANPTWGTVNTISQTQLDVYWNGVTNATGYNVKMDGNQVYTNIPYLSAPFTNLAPGSTHTFEVQAVNQWGVSGWSETRSGTTLPPVMPATPTWGTVNTISQTQLDVYWNAAANATGYNVKMNGTQIQTNIPYTSIPVTNLAPGSTHTFEVQGVNQYGVSAWSSQRSGTTQPIPIPTIASVSPQSDPACLNLVINASAGAVSYNVKAVVNGYTINVTQTSFPWCGLTPNTYYTFQAQAVTALGTSGWSSPIGGTTGAPPTPTPTPTPTPIGTPTLKLSKEYIYSGSRQLATEDYGIAPPNPTPTP